MICLGPAKIIDTILIFLGIRFRNTYLLVFHEIFISDSNVFFIDLICCGLFHLFQVMLQYFLEVLMLLFALTVNFILHEIGYRSQTMSYQKTKNIKDTCSTGATFAPCLLMATATIYSLF